MRLENWSVVVLSPSVYSAPEQGIQCLHGMVYGHPNFDDGERVTTTALHRRVGDKVRTKSGSEYELGKVDPCYAQQYPNPRERLLNSLPV